MTTIDRVVGAGVDRIDGPAKVRGTAPYAYEHHGIDEPVTYLAAVQSTVNRGRITRIASARVPSMRVIRPRMTVLCTTARYVNGSSKQWCS